jgi:methyl-accepting chemotaxis protein
MDLDHAVSAHEQWVFKFRDAIATSSTMDAATIAKDNCCELGKWLYGEGRTMHGNLTRFSDVVAKHAEFHKHAGQVAEAINAKKHKEAQDMIDYASTPFSQATQEVKRAILNLKSEAGQ